MIAVARQHGMIAVSRMGIERSTLAGFAEVRAVKARRFPMAEALRTANFRLFWIGETVSLFGNQFYIVAFPWLVLRLTESGLALGTLFMTMAAARAIFTLIGGAVTDRFSPRMVMIAANAVRGVVMAVLALLVFTHAIRMWQMYVLAVVYGIFDAFFFPAYKALLPRILPPGQLEGGNALLQGSSELAVSVGPALIGWAMGFGLALQAALGIDALSFWFSVLTLFLIRLLEAPQQTSSGTLLRSIKEGISYSFSNPRLCAFILNLTVLNFAMVGPFGIGIAVLAKQHFGNTASFGILFSAIAIGALVGNIIAGTLQGSYKFGTTLIVMAVNTGVGVILLGVVSSLAWLSAVLAVMGCINAITGVLSFSMLQKMIEQSMMGRVMSLVMMGRTGIAPLSYLFAGLMIRLGVRALFLVSGSVVLLASIYTVVNYRLWSSSERTDALRVDQGGAFVGPK
jgi:MFS family permease